MGYNRMEKEGLEYLDYLIDKAADFIGDDKKYRSITCIEAALDCAQTLKDDISALSSLREELRAVRRTSKQEAER